MNFKQSLESYKKQQIDNLRNMNKYAYNRVQNGIETFGTNIIEDTNDYVNIPTDDNSAELVLTLKDDESFEKNSLDIPVKFEHNSFNNSYIRSVHDQIRQDKTNYNMFASSFNK